MQCFSLGSDANCHFISWPDVQVAHLREMLVALTIVILLKLIIKPLIAGSLSTLFGFPELWKEVLVLLAAMPPAVLGAVFLRRYGGDASLASALLLGGTMVSCVSLLAVFNRLTAFPIISHYDFNQSASIRH